MLVLYPGTALLRELAVETGLVQGWTAALIDTKARRGQGRRRPLEPTRERAWATGACLLDLAIAALPENAQPRPDAVDGPKVMASADSAGATHVFAAALCKHGIGFSLGFTVDETLQQAILATPKHAWLEAYDADGQSRRGA